MIKTIFCKIRKRRTFYFLIFLSISSSILGMILPYINGTFVDVLLNAKGMSNIYKWVILLLLIGIFNIVVAYIYNITSKNL